IVKAQTPTQFDTLTVQAIVTITSYASSPSSSSNKSVDSSISLDGLKPLIITASCVGGVVVITIVICIIRTLMHKNRKHKVRSNHFDSSNYDNEKGHTNNNGDKNTGNSGNDIGDVIDSEQTNTPSGDDDKNTGNSVSGDTGGDIGVDNEQTNKPSVDDDKTTGHSGGGDTGGDIGGVVDSEQSHKDHNQSSVTQQTLNVASPVLPSIIINKDEEEKEVLKETNDTDVVLKIQSDTDSSDHKSQLLNTSTNESLEIDQDNKDQTS
ncbi:2004_t:CDS:2, partial [Gigaspora margarita]